MKKAGFQSSYKEYYSSKSATKHKFYFVVLFMAYHAMARKNGM
jgi:hypothetical protein